jgi:hypothetical protein
MGCGKIAQAMLLEAVAAGRSGYGMSCVLHDVTSKISPWF